MFELLLGVSGVGAKTALAMLAICEPSEFALAVITEDVKTLTGIPGIGPKSAKRIILELKDKISKEQEIEAINKEVNANKNNKIQQAIEKNNKVSEAISALQVLGYNRKEIEKAFEKIDAQEMSTEELIKKGLLVLGM
jgi:Holliday junction DNA helicase RuvA